MKHKIMCSVSALFTFAVGVAAAWMFYYSPPKQPQLETPPCRNCATVYAVASAELPTISLCDLASNPHRFENQMVRVRSFIKHDAGFFYLYDNACLNLNTRNNVEFNSQLSACDGVQKVFDDLLGYKHQCWKHPAGFDGDTGAVLVGRIERPKERNYGTPDGWQFRFVVMCVEEAFAIYPDNWH